ncbi:hypothetical protein ACWC9T_27705 [Kitasatospora sp. NPDC001159]
MNCEVVQLPPAGDGRTLARASVRFVPVTVEERSRTGGEWRA